METFLKEFRKVNGLTQDQLGNYLNIKKSFISSIENGRVRMPQDKFIKLMHNDQGWDVSMIMECDAECGTHVEQTVKGSGNKFSGTGNVSDGVPSSLLRQALDELAATRMQNKELERKLFECIDNTNSLSRDMMTLLMKQLHTENA